jgi:hypothetical protein
MFSSPFSILRRFSILSHNLGAANYFSISNQVLLRASSYLRPAARFSHEFLLSGMTSRSHGTPRVGESVALIMLLSSPPHLPLRPTTSMTCDTIAKLRRSITCLIWDLSSVLLSGKPRLSPHLACHTIPI